MGSTGFFSSGGRLRELLRKYGKVAIGVHLTVSGASIAGLYVAIKNNVDVETMLENMGIKRKPTEDQPKIEQSRSEQHSSIDLGTGDFDSFGDPVVQVNGSADQQLLHKRNKTAEMAVTSGGALALAILFNKALIPIRVPITIALTPPIARFLRARNIIKNGV